MRESNVCSKLWQRLRDVPQNRGYVVALVWVNILGAIYGFGWYRAQLANTNPLFWPVVPDSPLSTLLFGLVLLFLLRGRRPGLLMALGYVSMVKYGVWSLIVFTQAWWGRGFAYWEELFLFGSHLAMALEAVLFYPVFSPRKKHVILAGGWLLFNDYMDYVWGFHPYLPSARYLGSIRVYTPVLSVLVVLFFLFVVPASDSGARWFEESGFR